MIRIIFQNKANQVRSTLILLVRLPENNTNQLTNTFDFLIRLARSILIMLDSWIYFSLLSFAIKFIWCECFSTEIHSIENGFIYTNTAYTCTHACSGRPHDIFISTSSACIRAHLIAYVYVLCVSWVNLFFLWAMHTGCIQSTFTGSFVQCFTNVNATNTHTHTHTGHAAWWKA